MVGVVCCCDVIGLYWLFVGWLVVGLVVECC